MQRSITELVSVLGYRKEFLLYQLLLEYKNLKKPDSEWFLLTNRVVREQIFSNEKISNDTIRIGIQSLQNFGLVATEIRGLPGERWVKLLEVG